MNLEFIDHVTIRSRPQDIETLRDFYTEVLGLHPGPRPDFSFPGYWMYLHDRAVVHLAGTQDADAPSAPAGQPGATGWFDHLSFRTSGLSAVRSKLEKLGIPFKGVKVPGFDLYQLFFYDPAGVKIELTFDSAEAA